MKISYENPPMLDLIHAAGMRPVLNRTCFTYGDTLYNPGKLQNLPPEYMAHEETHTKQQGDKPDEWWARYLRDPYFRIDQEAEAMAVQYVYFKHHVNHDRNVAARFLFQLGTQLSSPTYGNVINHQAAMRMIQSYAGKIRV